MSEQAFLSPEALLFADDPGGFVEWLHGQHVNTTAFADDGVTPLWVRAVQRAHLIGFALLHERGIELSDGIPLLKQSEQEALLILLLSQLGAIPTLELALDKGLDPDALLRMATAEVPDLRNKKIDRRPLAAPALHILITGGHVAACAALLKMGASVDLVDSEGNSPLHKALIRPISSKTAVCPMRSLLQQYSPDLSVRNSQGYTAAEYSLAYFQAVMPEAVDSIFLADLLEVTPKTG